MNLAIRSLMILTAFSGQIALAEVPRPRVVYLSPAAQPAVTNGIADLRPEEKAFKETLPVQLTEPMRRIEKEKYKPKKSKS